MAEDMERINSFTIGNSNSPTRSMSYLPNNIRKMSIGTVAVQKLRESKWFQKNEERLFCAVIEYGFIVEFTYNKEDWFGIITHKIKKGIIILHILSLNAYSYLSVFYIN